jgi:hypothetical protein
MEKLYTIESDSPYHVKLAEIKNIEDAGDEFYTEEELQEALGITNLYTYSAIVKRAKVEEELNNLKQQIIKKGKKTIIIDDQELVDFFSHHGGAVSDYVKGLRRVGNRLFLHEKKAKTEATKRDFQSFVSRACNQISKLSNFNFDIKYTENNRPVAVEMIKKLLTWEQLIDVNKWNQVLSDEDKIWYKMIWDNPNYFDPIS